MNNIVKYSSFVVAGAAGFFTGVIYHDIARKKRFIISAAKPTRLEIDAIVSKHVEDYVSKLTSAFKYGIPSCETIRIKDNFVLSYDRRHRNPNWVIEHLTSDMLEKEASGDRSKSKFFEDETIHGFFRATLEDYRNSDYDRGHLAAAANHRFCQRAVDNTFVLSNITPQSFHFNRGVWNQLENHVRYLGRKYGSIYVCSGPLYLPRNTEQILNGRTVRKKYVTYEVIGDNNIAVPTHFFKIILCEMDGDKYDMESYIVPNEELDPKKPLSTYMVPRDTIERAAGFLIFPKLPSDMLR